MIIRKSNKPQPAGQKNGNQATKGAFSRFFSAQQTKVNSRKEVSNLLTHFAEDDLKKIAVMIQKWLDNDAREKANNKRVKLKK